MAAWFVSANLSYCERSGDRETVVISPQLARCIVDALVRAHPVADRSVEVRILLAHLGHIEELGDVPPRVPEAVVYGDPAEDAWWLSK